VTFFARRICEKNNLREKVIDDGVMWELQHYRWPGNVRELQNVVERMLIMSGAVVTLADLPAEVLVEDASIGQTGPSALKEFRDNAERDFIIAALRKNHGNVSQSALELGVGRTYLHRRLAVLKIAKKDFFV
jgi:DNA-binding NtrC family response regulator